MKQMIVAIVALLAGCGPSLAFRIDPAFGPAERAMVVAAAAEWCAATGGKDCIYFDDSADRQVRAWPGDGEHDGYSIGGGDVLVKVGQTPADFRSIITHEFGHALGLAEGPDSPEYVMCPFTARRAPTITAGDMAMYCSVNGCSIENGKAVWK